MKYQLIKWNIRNMGLWGFFKSRLMKPVKVDVTYKERIGYEEMEPLKEIKKVMLIKANGLAYEPLIRRILNKKKIYIEEEFVIDDYNRLMWHIFKKVPDKELSAWETINSTFYADKDGKVRGKAYIFSDTVDMDVLEKTKRLLRRKIGVTLYAVDEILADGSHDKFVTSITPLHVPDRKRMEREYSLICRYGRV